MMLEQFYLGCLAQASYLIGSEGTAAIVDPQRDVDIYLEAARDRNLKIQYVIETHLHADFVSGHRELAERTGARIYIGKGSGASFPHVAAAEGDEIVFGQCRLRFLHTPGHTLESMCVLITDLERRHEPWAVLTGDTLFIGDVGRPDLSDERTPQELAGLLYDSLREKLLTLPDDVLVYPAHGAGSMCGRNISADRSSTIGHERQFNYALQPMSRDQFVHIMTDELPPRPEYFHRDVDLNRHGASTLAELPPVRSLSPTEALQLQQSGAAILDTRPAADFCAGHIPGSINVGLSGQFAAWAASVLGLDRNIVLVVDEQAAVSEARQRLARVGIEHVAGYVEGGISGWVGSALPIQMTHWISVHDLDRELHNGALMSILDVRRPAEWETGHLPGAIHSPLDRLSSEVESVPRGRPLAVYCKSGYRSTIACSLLEAAGLSDLRNVIGGFDAWSGAGLPTVAG